MRQTALGFGVVSETAWTFETPSGPLPVHRRACPSCGAAPFQPTPYDLPPWRIAACTACGFVYMLDAPDAAAFSHELAWEQSVPREAERRAAARPLISRLSKATRFRLWLVPRREPIQMLARLVSPGPVIDLGCGPGAHLLHLPQGYVPYGIEISAALARRATAALAARGGRAICAPVLKGLSEFADGFFSGALLRSYLEHEAQPKEVLRELHRVLKPGAVALVKVPNYGSLNRRVMGRHWCGFRYPDHLNYFTPQSLARMAGNSGFDVAFRPWERLPTDDNMWARLVRLPGRNAQSA